VLIVCSVVHVNWVPEHPRWLDVGPGVVQAVLSDLHLLFNDGIERPFLELHVARPDVAIVATDAVSEEAIVKREASGGQIALTQQPGRRRL
jgi:hypothetical protein